MSKKPGGGGGQLLRYGVTPEIYPEKMLAGFLWCCRCKNFLTRDQFVPSQAEKKAGRNCRDCYAAYHRELHFKHRDRRVDKSRKYYETDRPHLRRFFKMTLEEYETLIKSKTVVGEMREKPHAREKSF